MDYPPTGLDHTTKIILVVQLYLMANEHDEKCRDVGTFKHSVHSKTGQIIFHGHVKYTFTVPKPTTHRDESLQSSLPQYFIVNVL